MTRVAQRRPRTRTARPKRAAPASPVRTWRLPSGVLAATWGAVLGLGLCAGFWWGFQRLGEYAAAATATVPLHVAWQNMPELAPEDQQVILGQIERSIAPVLRQQLSEPDLCRWVAEGVANVAWVERVNRVEKERDGSVRISATFRKPLARVDVQGRGYLVDAAGIRLPGEYNTIDLERGLVYVISGVRARVPEVGQRWSKDDPNAVTPDLAAGLRLAETLLSAERAGKLPFRAWLRGIDVSNFNRGIDRFQAPLRLLTIHPNHMIQWGEPPGTELTIEPTASQKIDALGLYYQSLGEIPATPIDLRNLQTDGDKLVIPLPRP